MSQPKTIGQQLKNLLPADRFLTVSKVSPSGSLQARCLSRGNIMFYWRYTADKKDVRVPIGSYASDNPPRSLIAIDGRYSVPAAQRKAEELATEHINNLVSGGSGYADVLREKKTLAASARKEAITRETYTVEKLCIMYCALLESRKKQSHKNVANIFKNHLIVRYPNYAALPAMDFSFEHAVEVLRTVLESGKDRTANKLRSYLHAAFKTAMRARTDISIPEEFKNFGISNNPISEIAPNADANRTDKNPLSLIELQAYWKIIQDVQGLKGDLLRCHLLTGGLRLDQLLRLVPQDVHSSYFILYDPKGRRSNARPYYTPITHIVHKSITARLVNLRIKDGFLFSSDGGSTHVDSGTMGGWAKDLVGDQIESFTLKRVRSGIETLFASKRVSKDVRAQLQSHGINGVQDRSYDGHDYLQEKREALELLEAELMRKEAGSVVLSASITQD